MHKVKGLTSEKQKRFMVAVPSAWLRPELKPGEWRAVGRAVGREETQRLSAEGQPGQPAVFSD